MFEDRYHPAVKKDIRKIDATARKDIKAEWIPRLLADPCCGEELTGSLSGIHSFHFKIQRVDYRIAYRIKKNEHIVEVLMIGKRESFYEILRRRFK